MEIFNAMNPINRINCERYTIKAFLTGDTGKAPRVVRLPCRAEDTVQDGVLAHTALLKGV